MKLKFGISVACLSCTNFERTFSSKQDLKSNLECHSVLLPKDFDIKSLFYTYEMQNFYFRHFRKKGQIHKITIFLRYNLMKIEFSYL